MAIKETTEATFAADTQGDYPVLVDFWAPWCGPCIALAPQLERLAADYAGRLKVLKLNIDEAPSGWQHFGVRSIPALVLYANGKEHNRVVGPSTMRLRVMIEKWLGELGLDATVPDSEAEPAGVDVIAHPRAWHSFGGDPELKAQCVARLRDSQHEKRLLPSELLAGGKDQFEAVIGAPAQLGELFNVGLMLPFVNVERARTQVGELAEALPVGVDLHAVSTDVLYDLVYRSEWEIMQSFDAGAGLEVMTRIRALHVREASGEAIPPADWQALQHEAVMVGEHPDSEDLSRMLEVLATPLAEWPAVPIVLLVMQQAATDYRRYPEWSRGEAQRTEAMRQKNDALAREAAGEMPKEPGVARDAWFEVAGKRFKTLDQQCREAQPTLWARYDAWRTHEQQIQKQVLAHLADTLLTRLRASAMQGA
ncbi:thioredoxin family protein [Burkholderia territorii]|uniref:thioredoxin family protein n=1 Tax=Burkholderia territorii TaxID=1503055 RepID=UPI0009BEEC3D|nr:thioredoxin domain-containing protein [Burkholderia territorii]